MKKILKKFKEKVKKIIFVNKYKKYKNNCSKEQKKEFLIFNAPIHGNLGDHAIIYSEYKLLEKLGIEAFEIPTYQERYYFNYIKDNISKNATIAITGGGFIGSQWLVEQKLVNKVVDTFKNNKIIIFPSTIFFKEDEIGKEELEKSIKVFNAAKNLKIFARENKTYEFAKKVYKNAKVELVPDIVLSLDIQKFEGKREGILLCLRKDVEGIFSEADKKELYNMIKTYNTKIMNTDTVINKAINAKKRNAEIEKKLKEFATSKLVITDRLHGMIFATITNTPCIVFSNYNYKVEGVYQWIKKVDSNIIYETNIKNIQDDIKQLLEKEEKFSANEKYDFSKLKEEIING